MEGSLWGVGRGFTVRLGLQGLCEIGLRNATSCLAAKRTHHADHLKVLEVLPPLVESSQSKPTANLLTVTIGAAAAAAASSLTTLYDHGYNPDDYYPSVVSIYLFYRFYPFYLSVYLSVQPSTYLSTLHQSGVSTTVASIYLAI